jgi:hypothetical protein
MYQGRAYEQARAHFDTVLALHAATPAGGTTSSGSSSAVKRVTSNSKLRVHPSHHLLVSMLPFAVNAWCALGGLVARCFWVCLYAFSCGYVTPSACVLILGRPSFCLLLSFTDSVKNNDTTHPYPPTHPHPHTHTHFTATR